MNSKSTTAMGSEESRSLITGQLALVSGIVVLCILVARLVLSKIGQPNTSLTITNKNGERLPEIDVRSKKFRSSRELSRKIKNSVGASPCLVRTGPNQELVLSTAQDVQDFYGQDYGRHMKTVTSQPGSPFGYVMPGAAAPPVNQDWRKIRKHFEPQLSIQAVSQRVPRFTREIKTWVKNLDVDFVDSRQTFDLILFRMMYLHLYEDAYDDRKYWSLLQLYLSHKKAVEVTQGSAKLAKKFDNEWQEFCKMIVEVAQRGRWSCPVEVIYRGVDAKDITEEEYLSTLSEIMFNNVESTCQVLSTVFTKLAANRAVQDSLRSEIQENEDVSDVYLHKSDTLLHRVLQESLRLSPAMGKCSHFSRVQSPLASHGAIEIPSRSTTRTANNFPSVAGFSMPELASDATTIAGYRVPAIAPVVIDAHCVHHDSAIWGPDYDLWDPDRFLRVDSKTIRSGFFPYGAGATSERCLWRNAADIIFKIIIVSIVDQISLEAVGDGGLLGGENTDLNLRRLK
ncbi:cytochrome P450 [Xylaria arbuscula]|nr:cytochrome P450 [Xylaria arbuscula]